MTTHDSTLRLPEPRATIAAMPAYSRAAGLDRVQHVASSNESPVSPSPEVVAAVSASAQAGNRYPSMLGDDLTAALAKQYGTVESRLIVTGGSIAALQFTLTAYAGPGAEVVYAWRSYEAYPIAVRIAGAEPREVPLASNYRHDLEAMVAAVDRNTAAVIICNPNNPTGTAVETQAIREFIAAVPSHVLVILDEAYREFLSVETDGLDLLVEFDNLVVLRTFSKAYGLAGIRAGYALASEQIIQTLRKVAPPFGLSRLAESAALSALEDTVHMRHIVDTISAERDALWQHLTGRGLEVPKSSSNFVWIPTRQHAGELVNACLDRGVSVRAFSGEGVRVTVGEPEVTAAVVEAVDILLPQLLTEGQ